MAPSDTPARIPIPPHLRGRNAPTEVKPESTVASNGQVPPAIPPAQASKRSSAVPTPGRPVPRPPPAHFILNTKAGAAPNIKSPEKSRDVDSGMKDKPAQVSAKVSQPKTASKAALVAYASSENTDVPESTPVEASSKNASTGESSVVNANLSQDLPSAQPSKGQSAPAAQVTNGMSMTYAAAAKSSASAKSFKSNSPAPATKNGSAPMARGNYLGGHIQGRSNVNESRWPKKIPNGDPRRWEIN